jgi:hypothetical protein
MRTRRQRRGAVILLDDLAPRQEVKGGAGKRVFGERVPINPSTKVFESRKPAKKGPSKSKS